jgi:hypothetical protein
MKTIRIQLEDPWHERLKALCTHHGEFSHLIRQGIRLIIKQKEQENQNAPEPTRPPAD